MSSFRFLILVVVVVFIAFSSVSFAAKGGSGKGAIKVDTDDSCEDRDKEDNEITQGADIYLWLNFQKGTPPALTCWKLIDHSDGSEDSDSVVFSLACTKPTYYVAKVDDLFGNPPAGQYTLIVYSGDLCENTVGADSFSIVEP